MDYQFIGFLFACVAAVMSILYFGLGASAVPEDGRIETEREGGEVATAQVGAFARLHGRTARSATDIKAAYAIASTTFTRSLLIIGILYQPNGVDVVHATHVDFWVQKR